MIVRKTGLSAPYVSNIMFLLERGEDRLIDSVQKGQIPLSTAVEIVKAAASDQNLGDVLQKAYEDGELRGKQLIEARKLIEKRKEDGPAMRPAEKPRGPMTTTHLVRSFQSEVARKKKMVIKAEYSQNKVILIIESLRRLLRDEHFLTLLRAEGLETLPAALADRL
jgi:ParB family chromosome partitioning protein